MKFIAVIIAVIIAGISNANAQSNCSKRQIILSVLEKEFDEKQINVALNSAGNLIEVFSSKNGETWTVIVTNPNKISCLVSSGVYWKTIKQGKIEGEPM